MTVMFRLAIAVVLAAGAAAAIDPALCTCDPARPETMNARQCSLCREAEKQPPDVDFFYLKDNNPRKPNRWLVLPRAHREGNHPLADMTPEERTTLWTAAIRKGRELFGDDWAVAYNGDLVRTQCHTHIHIGKLVPGVETRDFIAVNGPADIPPPRDGEGLWIHPDGNRLHVHRGEQTCETVLLR
jgi:CDP-diacylglycerol pyrophosphatase